MGGMLIPAPRNKRQDFQEQSIRDAEIPPDDYYPNGYKPDLIPFWPTSKPIFIPADQVPPEMARPLLQSALANYEHVITLQTSYWASLGDHPKGELLFGLAEGWARLGDQQKARMYFERVIADAPTSGQAPKAQQWMKTGTLPKAEGAGCVGCHK
jgi:hypothetical protein